jgi:hypothetical protein
MRISHSALALLFCSSTLALTMPHIAMAQDVFAPLPNDDSKKPDDAKDDSPSLFNYFIPKKSAPTPAQKDTHAVAPKKQKDAPSPYIVSPQNDGTQGRKKLDKNQPPQKELPPDIKKMMDEHNANTNNLMDQLNNPKTLVIPQKDFKITDPSQDDRKYDHNVSVTFGKMNYTNADLVKVAKGTELRPESILKTCEQRITGTIITEDGSGELVDLRGNGTAATGYKGTIHSVNLVLAMACQLNSVPQNKGIVPKFGDSYIFGVAQGTCPPPLDNAIITTIAINYGGDGHNITCDYNKPRE